MKKVRLGIIGLGSSGAPNAQSTLAGKTPRIKLTVIANSDCGHQSHPSSAFTHLHAFTVGNTHIKSGAVVAVLIAPGEECTHSVELANTKPLSTFEHKAIGLSLNAARYMRALKEKSPLEV